MEKITFKFPQIILVGEKGSRKKYLERLVSESEEPKVNLTFQKDSKEDSRIITIKYQFESDESESYVMYYSETLNNHKLITANLGYGYIGKVFVRDKNNHKMGINLEHQSKNGLRIKHVDRINALEDIKENLTPEHVAKRYKEFFYNLLKFI